MTWPVKMPLPSTLVLGAIVVMMAKSTLLDQAEVVSRAEASRVPASLKADPAAQMIEPIDLSSFVATLERPVFSPLRRPYEPEPVVAPVEPMPIPEPEVFVPDAGGISLSGTMKRNGVISALLNGFTENRWVVEGDTFEGWSIVEIENGGVVLQQDDHVARKGIFDY